MLPTLFWPSPIRAFVAALWGRDMADTSNFQSIEDQKLKEAYFTASQSTLIWQRFKRNKSALIGAWVLIALVLSGIFAPFLTPYDVTISGRDNDYINGAPDVPRFWY